MFLCNNCHSRANCAYGFIEGLMPSHGRCEMCDKVSSCLDCHDYNFRPAPSEPEEET